MHLFQRIIAAVAISIAASGAVHAATLNGATVDVNFYFPDSVTLFCASGSAVVGAGTEYPAGCLGFSAVSIDITGTQVIVGHLNTNGFSAGSFNGFVMDILFGPNILSLAYNAGASTLGVTSTSFSATSMSFNFADQGFGTAVFDVTAGPAAVIPLPAASLMLLTGLGGMAVLRRRRRS